jgi:hypothetical protein
MLGLSLLAHTMILASPSCLAAPGTASAGHSLVSRYYIGWPPPKVPDPPPPPSCCCLRPEDMQSTDSVKGQCISCPASLPKVAWWTLPALQLYMRAISPIFNLTWISYAPGLLFSDYLWFLFRETFYCLIWVAADFKEWANLFYTTV